MVDTARARAEAALRRDATLEAVAFASQRFLEERAWEGVVPEVLRRLGRATSASRAYVFENRPAEDGALSTSLRWEWVAEGIQPERENPALQDLSWETAGLGRWAKVLGSGAVLQGHVREFPPSEHGILERQAILSLLEVPIFVSGRWWGLIGFDDCIAEREWSQVEIDALRTAAGVLGAAIQRRLAEEQLHETEREYRVLVEHNPAVTYREAVDANPEGFYISPQVKDMLGYDPDEWRWAPHFWRDLIHPEDLARVLEADKRSNDTGFFSVDYRLRAADGNYRWIHDEATVVLDDRGEPLFWQGFMVDITGRKRAERGLQEAEARYRALVEQVPAAIYTQVVGEDGSTNTIYMSPRVEEMLGYTVQDLLSGTGGLWRDLIHPDDREAVAAEDARTNATGEPFAMEYRMVAKDGRAIWVRDEASVAPDAEGRPRFWQGFMLDVTERKRVEERLERALEVEREAADRLRALDEMKNTFLQAVSHDLRTPLAAILGLAVTLERADIQLETSEARDLARRIAANARRLDRMVTDLLDLDRLARGIVEPKLYPTDVGALVRRVVSESDLTAQGRIQVQAAPVVANVDAAKVERIVENLLANTVRHTPADARVWVRVEPAEGGVLIAVDDEGPGVPEELRAAIFEPFRQGPQAASYSPGVGVGLALVAKFAELLGGRAWVQERAGGGASFRVFLADAPIAADDERQDAPGRGPGRP